MNIHKIHHYVNLERNHHLPSYSIFFNLSYEQHQKWQKNPKTPKEYWIFQMFQNFQKKIQLMSFKIVQNHDYFIWSWIMWLSKQNYSQLIHLMFFTHPFFCFLFICSCMLITMFVFHFYDTREEKRVFQGFFFIWSIFITWSPIACFNSLMRFWF